MDAVISCASVEAGVNCVHQHRDQWTIKLNRSRAILIYVPVQQEIDAVFCHLVQWKWGSFVCTDIVTTENN